jgi:hypothetical protein
MTIFLAMYLFQGTVLLGELDMECMSIVLLSGLCLFGPPDQGSWEFIASSSGENYIWVSPKPIAADGQFYEMLYTVQSATVMVSYIGINFGPIDVMDMIPDEHIESWNGMPGPAPLDFSWYEVVAPEDQDPPAIAYDWIVEVNEQGYVTYRMENLYFGQSEYDLGWPWGSVTVNIESGSIGNLLEVQIVASPCYADVNNDSIVDVNDLLEIIGSWGYCFECVGDTNQDSYIDVTDLLAVVAAWGPCPR